MGASCRASTTTAPALACGRLVLPSNHGQAADMSSCYPVSIPDRQQSFRNVVERRTMAVTAPMKCFSVWNKQIKMKWLSVWLLQPDREPYGFSYLTGNHDGEHGYLDCNLDLKHYWDVERGKLDSAGISLLH